MHELLPGLRAYCCWDGGYVIPFLQRIRQSLPAERFVHIAMYSMSTETLETLAYYVGSRAHFLPIAPGVYYEFLPEGADDDTFVALRQSAMTAKHDYLSAGRGRKSDFLAAQTAAEEYLDDVPTGSVGMSRTSRALLGQVDAPSLIQARRRHFARLAEGLGALPMLRPLVPDLPSGVCPLGLPVVTPHRDALKRHRVRRHIYPAWHWARPDAVDPAAHPTAAGLAESVMTLVCDQRYNLRDMDRTLDALGRFRP
jgi:hypothetical protein